MQDQPQLSHESWVYQAIGTNQVVGQRGLAMVHMCQDAHVAHTLLRDHSRVLSKAPNLLQCCCGAFPSQPDHHVKCSSLSTQGLQAGMEPWRPGANAFAGNKPREPPASTLWQGNIQVHWHHPLEEPEKQKGSKEDLPWQDPFSLQVLAKAVHPYETMPSKLRVLPSGPQAPQVIVRMVALDVAPTDIQTAARMLSWEACFIGHLLVCVYVYVCVSITPSAISCMPSQVPPGLAACLWVESAHHRDQVPGSCGAPRAGAFMCGAPACGDSGEEETSL
eukprot:scaffold8400_cov22-Tisochrysis_lutea.AAC.3